MSSIFLSHNRKDKSFIRRLSEKLKSHGIRTWVDEAEMHVGDSLFTKIESAIKEFNYLGVVLSPNSISSEWVRREVNIALTEEINGKKVKVLPILYKKCDIPGFLVDKIYADFTEDFNNGFDKLLARLLHDLSDKEHKEKRIQNILLTSYQDWISFGKQKSFLLDISNINLLLEFLSDSKFSLDILEYILCSISSLIMEHPNTGTNIGIFKKWIDKLDGREVSLLIRQLLEYPEPRVRIGAIKFIEFINEERVISDIADHVKTESDTDVRKCGVQCICKLQYKLPKSLSYFLLLDEDWIIQSYALKGFPNSRNCLLISDGTDFSTEIGILAKKAGYRLVCAPSSYFVLSPIVEFEDILNAFELVIIVRGEHFSQYGKDDFYEIIRKFVAGGGYLFATAWTSWEAKYLHEFSNVLPFNHFRDTFMENISIDCKPTSNEISNGLFTNSLKFMSSIELLQNKEDSIVLLETKDGIPIFGYRSFGKGICYYFNTCQHSCIETMKSPFQDNNELYESFKNVFSWIYQTNQVS